ncbi:ChaN family lipoprotein [Jiella sp. MQZ9-1]|uniref:ChaN family lipoprotein n=1 Tax=Jiella flava TaxID=2816857 RepID=A0A939JXW8_9HYPH|nr:ChaN family lipoprotein [Jiella flava]MCD2472374.1 ChaN family lipoprotein [Jiella flava]
MSDRVSLAYRKKGDEDFASVHVATVEPFAGASHRALTAGATDGDGDGAGGAGATALAPDATPTGTKNGAAAFLNKVAAAGDAAATDAAVHPAFETTRLSNRGFDDDEAHWKSRFFSDNPLVGGIFQGDGRPSDAASLLGAAQSARYLLLGENHDNPDHHRLQADIVSDLAKESNDMALVFEMIPQHLNGVVADFGTKSDMSLDLDTLGDKLAWSQRGWPDFSMYRPLFEAAKSEGLPVSGGDLDPAVVSSMARNGLSALPPEERKRLSLDDAVKPENLAELMDEIRDAHCGLMPSSALAAMADAQQARDRSLAAAMIDAAKTGDKAVLIAGAGHVRKDRGVPSIIERKDTDGHTLSVRMMEVAGQDSKPADYGLKADQPAPYDFTIFTPRASVDDPCEALRTRTETEKAEKAGIAAN